MDWHYLKDGRQFGPVPETSIRAWLESGFLKSHDLVWHSGMNDWAPIAEVPDIVGGPSGSLGQPIAGPPSGWPLGTPLAPPAGYVAYAGFWLRAAAYILDSLLLSFVLLAIWYNKLTTGMTPEQLMADKTLLGVSFGLSWLYFAIFESSPWQATIGKRLFHLIVTDLDGRRIPFLRASLRQIGKLASGLVLYVGYVMAAFTPRRQTLHDMLAGCLVVKADARRSPEDSNKTGL